MIIEEVNFNAEVIKGMSRDEFISRHMPYLWRDRDAGTRRSMLDKAYTLITGDNPGKRKNRRKKGGDD